MEDELDPEFLRKQWMAQRVGWTLMALVVLAGLAGLAGTGPLAEAMEAREQDGVRVEVEYPRYTRYQHADRIHVRVHAPDAPPGDLKVTFSPGFVHNVVILGATPAADGGGVGPDGATYAFVVEDWSEPLRIVFAFESRKAFGISSAVRVETSDNRTVTLPMPMWVHP